MPVAETLRFLGAGLCLVACGSSGDVSDAGSDVVYGHKSLDAAPYEAAIPEAAPFDRMEEHSGIVLPMPNIQAVYVGQTGIQGYASFDAFLTWLLGSTDYWSILAQYGVGYGAFQGSVQVDTAAFFTPGMVVGGMVDALVLQARVQAVIHETPSDAGVDEGDAGDGGDVVVPPIPPIPTADAYIFFLPDDINVNLEGEGQTCVGIGGYHSYDGNEPFAIIPSCGRSGLVVSHEMAEMCTDPVPGLGWFSDADEANAGGEVGDLCNYTISVDNNDATALWSNKDGQCEPQ
jgi:hypothetical protein